MFMLAVAQCDMQGKLQKAACNLNNSVCSLGLGSSGNSDVLPGGRPCWPDFSSLSSVAGTDRAPEPGATLQSSLAHPFSGLWCSSAVLI